MTLDSDSLFQNLCNESGVKSPYSLSEEFNGQDLQYAISQKIAIWIQISRQNGLLVLRSTNLMSKMEISGLIYHFDIAFDILNSLKAELGSGVK